jgi:hypothetical protein
MQSATLCVPNDALTASQELGKLPNSIPEEIETIEYMGHSFRIWPEIILVNGAKKRCFNLAINNENRVRHSFETRTYAIMEGARIIFHGEAAAA